MRGVHPTTPWFKVWSSHSGTLRYGGNSSPLQPPEWSYKISQTPLGAKQKFFWVPLNWFYGDTIFHLLCMIHLGKVFCFNSIINRSGLSWLGSTRLVEEQGWVDDVSVNTLWNCCWRCFPCWIGCTDEQMDEASSVWQVRI